MEFCRCQEIFDKIMKIKYDILPSNILLDYLGNLPDNIGKRSLLRMNEPIKGLEYTPDMRYNIDISAVNWNKIVFRDSSAVSLFSEPFPVNMVGLVTYRDRYAPQNIIELVEMRKWVIHFQLFEHLYPRFSFCNLLEKSVHNFYLESDDSEYTTLKIIDNELIDSGSLTKSAR